MSADDRGARTIVLVGGDEAGLEKAISMWTRFLEYGQQDYGHWFRP